MPSKVQVNVTTHWRKCNRIFLAINRGTLGVPICFIYSYQSQRSQNVLLLIRCIQMLHHFLPCKFYMWNNNFSNLFIKYMPFSSLIFWSRHLQSNRNMFLGTAHFSRTASEQRISIVFFLSNHSSSQWVMQLVLGKDQRTLQQVNFLFSRTQILLWTQIQRSFNLQW